MSFGLSMQLLSRNIKLLNVENKKINFFGLIPGPIKSNIRKKMFPGEDIENRFQLSDLVELYKEIKLFTNYNLKFESTFKLDRLRFIVVSNW